MNGDDELAPDIRTDTTRPYTAMIPDMTTGMRDWVEERSDEAHAVEEVGTHFHDQFRSEGSETSNPDS